MVADEELTGSQVEAIDGPAAYAHREHAAGRTIPLDGARIAGIVTEDGIVDPSDHRASALPVPEPEPEQERSHPLVGKCRIRGCSGKLRDHTPDDSDGSVLKFVCDKCGLAFSFTPAPWRVAQTQALRAQRSEKRGRA